MSQHTWNTQIINDFAWKEETLTSSYKRDNTVYILYLPDSQTDVKEEKLEEIATKAKEIYKTVYGIDVEVVVFDETKYGKFNPKYLDSSDSVIILGARDKVADCATKFSGIKDFTDWKNTLYKGRKVTAERWPETSERPGKIVAIDGNVMKENADANETDIITYVAYVIVHGTGHNSGQNHHQYRISIMTDGAEALKFITGRYPKQKNYQSIEAFIESEQNKELIAEFKKKFSAEKAGDSYLMKKVIMEAPKGFLWDDF